ncbi:MAG: TonB-dependent receptor domain-containing protein [Poseidonibacter sp.]|uniref:TonB-dependent receptor domain-containing protein n=1 Tax=Poseidonibacter sp. TaxID=2321188 RepID=UPI00359D6F17
MKKIYLIFILLTNILLANNLNNLLEEYKTTSEKSLQTVDEKLGHVLVYSQKDLRLMQYNKLNDILKELPLLNLNKNRFGVSSPSLAGTKTTVSGFFRLFINDHEVSSVHTQSFSLLWGEMPLDFIDHIEVYYGESSFALGNETGVYFIRVYTKSAKKENSTQLKTTISDDKSHSQSITHSQSFKNGWSYLLFLNQNELNDSNTYKNQELKNDSNSRYLYLDISNDTTNINIGYSDINKDAYMGLALDVKPEVAQTKANDYFININKYLLEDRSLKIGASYHISTREYKETNSSGIGLIPIIDLTQNPANTIPKEFSEDLKFTKTTAFISKSFNTDKNNFLTAFHIKNKTYEVDKRKTVNFTNQNSINQKFNDYDKETTYSLLFEDDYKINDKIMLIANAKYDKYRRSGYLENLEENMHRIGMIFTPYNNFGLKTFYTKTYLPPSFYNADFESYRNGNIKTQKYDIFTTEAVFTTTKSKLGITYHNVKINDFIYLTPIGFENIDHEIKTSGLIFDYEYLLSDEHKIKLNYFTTKSSEQINNSDKGAYIKFMGEYSKFEYFASLIYRNKYEYKPSTSNIVSVKDSYNLNLGASYNYSKDLTFSIKGENLLDKSTKSLYSDGFPGTNFALKDYDRNISFSVKWVF